MLGFGPLRALALLAVIASCKRDPPPPATMRTSARAARAPTDRGRRLPPACARRCDRPREVVIPEVRTPLSVSEATPWFVSDRFTGLERTTRPPRRVAVGVIDSAVKFRDPHFEGRVVNRLECPDGIDGCANGRDDDGNGRVDDIAGWNILTRSPDVDRERFPGASGGHGTRVASVIAATRSGGTWGANPWVDVIPVVVAERRAADAGLEAVASSDDIFDGLCYLLDLRQRGLDLVAINVSMGYCGWEASPCDHDRLVQITDALAEEGVLIVAASANMGSQCTRDGARTSCSNHDECPWHPASFDRRNVLGVTSAGAAAGMCSGGAGGPDCPGHGRSIELMGPGSLVPTLGFDGSPARAAGTSFAAPIVTAIAALVSASLPERPSAEALRARLVRSVSPPTHPDDAHRTCSGGMINAPRAIAGEGDAGARCGVQ